VEGRSYGYIRLYTLEVESRRQVGAVREINQDVDEFQRRKVDAVVLDEFGNGGGDFLFGAALLSRFASKPLHLPRQQYLLENDGSVAGVGSRPAIERFAARLGAIRTNEDAARFMNADPIFAGALSFLPRSLASIRGVTDFFQFFLEQPAAGAQSLLSPHYEIQEAVVPDASLGPAFQGPLLLLIDEETLSAPEFLAAALVDGGRAEAFGTRTSGAGGDQRWISRDRVCPQGQDRDERLFTECVPKKISGIMRNLGVAGFGYTVTLGVRVLADGTLGEKIENRGVSPQIEYAVTESDLRESFRPMAARIVRVLRSPDFLK
jgi:hypothetical protein